MKVSVKLLIAIALFVALGCNQAGSKQNHEEKNQQNHRKHCRRSVSGLMANPPSKAANGTATKLKA
jgi:hypothetical protein